MEPVMSQTHETICQTGNLGATQTAVGMSGQASSLEIGDRQLINSTAEPTLPELFESQARQTPDAVALVFEGRELSYRELNDRANQLAHELRAIGVRPEVLVGICLERSVEMVVAL